MPLLSCRDAKRDYLRSFGYGTFALPKAGVQPLTMLSYQGDRLTPIGPLAGTFKPGPVPIPEIVRNRAASISGAQSRALDAGLGLEVLGAAIGALSGSTLGFKAAYKKASKVEFEFGDVFENSVNETDLDAYLASALVSEHLGPALRTMLNDDKVFVLVSTIDSRQISVKASNSSGTDLGLEVPVVQQLVGGKITVGSKAEASSVITYTSTDTPLAIGGQVVKLVFDKNKYQTMKLIPAGKAEFGLAPSKPKPSDAAPDKLIEL